MGVVDVAVQVGACRGVRRVGVGPMEREDVTAERQRNTKTTTVANRGSAGGHSPSRRAGRAGRVAAVDGLRRDGRHCDSPRPWLLPPTHPLHALPPGQDELGAWFPCPCPF